MAGLIHLELLTDFFNEIGHARHFKCATNISGLNLTPDISLHRREYVRRRAHGTVVGF